MVIVVKSKMKSSLSLHHSIPKILWEKKPHCIPPTHLLLNVILLKKKIIPFFCFLMSKYCEFQAMGIFTV